MAHVFYTNFSTPNFSFTDFFKAVSSKTLQIKIDQNQRSTILEDKFTVKPGNMYAKVNFRLH